MADVTRITLVVSWKLAYCRAVLRGVSEFAADRPRWTFTPLDPDTCTAAALRATRPNGVIAHVPSRRLETLLLRWGGPTVNVSGILPAARLPWVGIDDAAVGRTAAEHLLDRGLRHFAFTGVPLHGYSARRATAFRSAVESRGLKVVSYAANGIEPFDPQGHPWGRAARLADWVSRLPKPVGIAACNDFWALQLTETCRLCGLRVPQDVAILGVDDDDLLCGLARPPLSSVSVPGERVGREAAACLESQLARRSGWRRAVRVARRPLLLPPNGVTTRRSTDHVATPDADVARAVQLIRHADPPRVTVDQVLDAVAVGRRSLERRFRRAIGHGIFTEIRRTQFATARRLLIETALPIATVAARAGFTSPKHLSTAFHRHMQCTPSAYRDAFAEPVRSRQ